MNQGPPNVVPFQYCTTGGRVEVPNSGRVVNTPGFNPLGAYNMGPRHILDPPRSVTPSPHFLYPSQPPSPFLAPPVSPAPMPQFFPPGPRGPMPPPPSPVPILSPQRPIHIYPRVPQAAPGIQFAGRFPPMPPPHQHHHHHHPPAAPNGTPMAMVAPAPMVSNHNMPVYGYPCNQARPQMPYVPAAALGLPPGTSKVIFVPHGQMPLPNPGAPPVPFAVTSQMPPPPPPPPVRPRKPRGRPRNSKKRVVQITPNQYLVCCSDISDEEEDNQMNIQQPQIQQPQIQQPPLQQVPQVPQIPQPLQQVPQFQPNVQVGPYEGGMETNHKKFNYRHWTQGRSTPTPPVAQPSPGPAMPQDPRAFQQQNWDLNRMLNNLNLSPYITLQQAKDRLLALGCTEKVQNEIDTFAAIIQCGNAYRGTPLQYQAPSARVAPTKPTPPPVYHVRPTEPMMQSQGSARTVPYNEYVMNRDRREENVQTQRESVIKQRIP